MSFKNLWFLKSVEKTMCFSDLRENKITIVTKVFDTLESWRNNFENRRTHEFL